MTINDLIPTTMSLALVSENLKAVKKKKNTSKDLIKLGLTNVIGASLIQETSKNL